MNRRAAIQYVTEHLAPVTASGYGRLTPGRGGPRIGQGV